MQQIEAERVDGWVLSVELGGNWDCSTEQGLVMRFVPGSFICLAGGSEKPSRSPAVRNLEAMLGHGIRVQKEGDLMAPYFVEKRQIASFFAYPSQLSQSHFKGNQSLASVV